MVKSVMSVKNYNMKDDFRENEFYKNYYNALTENQATRTTRSKGYSFVAALRHYLKFRNITIEELIMSGKKEIPFFDEFMLDEDIKLSKAAKSSHLRRIKHFLRYTGADIPRCERKKKLLFPDDEIMLLHLNNDIGSSWSTQKQVNRAIAFYIEYRQSIGDDINTPTQVINEVKFEKISVDELKDKLIGFYNWRRTHKDNSRRNIDGTKLISETFAWNQMIFVVLFYQHRANVFVKIPNNKKPKDKFSLSLPMGLSEEKKIVTQATMNKLLLSADLRTSAALMIAFECGIHPTDLASMTYGLFNYYENGVQKNYLNIEEPYSIQENKIVFIKHIRSKTGREILIGLSGQSLRLISLYLKARVAGQFGLPDVLTDDSYIISREGYPYNRVNGKTINHLFTKCSELAGLEAHIPSDFRNSFISRASVVVNPLVVKIIVGHSIGLQRNYQIITDKETPTNLERGLVNIFQDYKACWEQLFDLTQETEKVIEAKNFFLEKAAKLEAKLMEIEERELMQEEAYEQELIERAEILAQQEPMQVTDEQAKKYLSSLTKDELVDLLLKKEEAKS